MPERRGVRGLGHEVKKRDTPLESLLPVSPRCVGGKDSDQLASFQIAAVRGAIEMLV